MEDLTFGGSMDQNHIPDIFDASTQQSFAFSALDSDQQIQIDHSPSTNPQAFASSTSLPQERILSSQIGANRSKLPSQHDHGSAARVPQIPCRTALPTVKSSIPKTQLSSDPKATTLLAKQLRNRARTFEELQKRYLEITLNEPMADFAT
jgi:hypothetical protein